MCKVGKTLLSLDISFNYVGGTIPQCFGETMKELKRFRLTNTGIVGSIPERLCGVREMNNLFPNILGCNGIACSAGTFLPPLGRQVS